VIYLSGWILGAFLKSQGVNSGMSWYDTVLAEHDRSALPRVFGKRGSRTRRGAKKIRSRRTPRERSGPNATDAEVAIATTKAQNEVDSYLKTTNAHPDQAGIRLPGLGVIGLRNFSRILKKWCTR